ncbi:MAG: ABC transporter permease [Planctomycetota bacterium]|nr:ABC transporter permease [Planctomycetota bacterium]
MLFWTIIKVALKGLLANKLRSFLAVLGIVIGVGAVISMLAVGAGAQHQVLARMTAMGTNLLIVRPGNRPFAGVVSGTQQNLKEEDALAITSSVPGVFMVAPVVGGMAQIKYMGSNTRCQVTGTTPTYLEMRNFEVARGRPFTDAEVERAVRVAILGPVTAENLFGNDDPVGETIKIKGINFQVIGVLKPKGDQGWFNPDDQAIVPYTVAMKQLFGLDYLREIDIQCADLASLSDVQTATTELLRTRHRIMDEAQDDFHIFNQAEMIETVSSVSRTFTILLGSIAGISLLVGGIGIMNIMLVAVTERTREIGVRKAIGAKDRDILGQFLVEAVVMSGIGGLLGVGAGIGAARIIERATEYATRIEPLSVLVALAFSASVGIFFGFYPASRAARLDPIEALRYE